MPINVANLAQDIADEAATAVGADMTSTIKDALRDGLFTAIAQALKNELERRDSLSSSTTLTDANATLVVLTTNNLAINLPSSPTPGMPFIIRNDTGVSGENTVSGNGKNIDGATGLTLTNARAFVSVVYTGTEWMVLSSNLGV